MWSRINEQKIRTNFRRFLRKDFARLLLSKIERDLKRHLIAFMWPLISGYLRKVSKSTNYLSPVNYNPEHALILVGSINSNSSIQVPGIDLTKSIESWVRERTSATDVRVITSLDSVSQNHSKGVIIVSYDWLIAANRWLGFFREIRALASKAKKLGFPIWVAPPDPFSLEYVILISILVAKCGGSTILQSNTTEEGKEFGLIFPTGPHIWTLTPLLLESLNSKIPWADRDRNMLLAMSGDPRRRALMNSISLRFSKSNWLIKNSNLELTWPEYIELVKSCRIIITTCWMYQVHINGSRRTKSKIPSMAVTHRVWEGFAAGCTVVTNSNSVFDSLGFRAGVHYVEIWEKFGSIDNIELPSENILEQIAQAGYDLFSKLIRGDINS